MDTPGPPFEPPDDIPAVSAEDLVDGEVVPGQPPAGRRYPSTVGGAFYLAVLAVGLLGLVLVALGPWRLGIGCLGAALLFAAAVRVVLSDENAGMLAVRHKAVDATLLVTLGVLLITLARSIPDQPG